MLTIDTDQKGKEIKKVIKTKVDNGQFVKEFGKIKFSDLKNKNGEVYEIIEIKISKKY